MFRSRSSTGSSTDSSLDTHIEALRSTPTDLSVGRLQDVGRSIALCLHNASKGDESNTTSWPGESTAAEVYQEQGLAAAALFTSACSNRPQNEQRSLLGVQDKVLAGLRPLSSSSHAITLPTAQQRHLQIALLSLVTQSGFTKKKSGGYRQHLVQALVEGAKGHVPPTIFLPILRATETGPAVSDIILEVLKRVTNKKRSEDHGPESEGRVDVASALYKEVNGFIHHVVADVVTGGRINRKASQAKRNTSRDVPPHILSFLTQACSSLPAYVIVFAKDLLHLMESRSSYERKLSLSVLAVVVARGGTCRGARRTALAAMLRCARSDRDATVRCAAFDCLIEHVAKEGRALNHDEDDKEEMQQKDNASAQIRRSPRKGPPSKFETCNQIASSEEHMSHSEQLRGPQARHDRGQQAAGTALVAVLSVSAHSLLDDDSKAVRLKALSCSLQILEAHGAGADDFGRRVQGPFWMDAMAPTLAAVERGAWAALENLAVGTSSAAGTTSNATAAGTTLRGASGSKLRKAFDSARDLLCLLPQLDIRDLLSCFERCRTGRVTGAPATAAALEAVRVLREVLTKRFCTSSKSLHRAVSVVTTSTSSECGWSSDAGDKVERHPTLAGTVVSWKRSADCHASEVCMKTFGELLAGVDGTLLASLQRDTLNEFAQMEDNAKTVARDEKGLAMLLRTTVLLGEASGHSDGGAVNGEEARNRNYTSRTVHRALHVLVESERVLWRVLERLVYAIPSDDCRDATDAEKQRGDRGPGETSTGSVAGHVSDGDDLPLILSSCGSQRCDADNGSGECQSPRARRGIGGERDNRGGKSSSTAPASPMEDSEAILELAELLGVFGLLASRSLLSAETGAALEVLVYPMALSKRRLIRPAVALALALEEPHRVLLSSLAVLQDAAFSRSSIDVGRACDYVRLIGVLARENALFIAAHVCGQYGTFRSNSHKVGVGDTNLKDSFTDGDDEAEDDYLADVSSREHMEREIRQLQEASVTSDGMLSCYTPFLLAIVKQRVADQQQRRTSESIQACNRPRRDGDDGDALNQEALSTSVTSPLTLRQLSCLSLLCVEALLALSDYAVLSPTLATSEVLPLAEELAENTLERSLVRRAAVCVLTRKELATDAMAERTCQLLRDPDPLLRRDVLASLARLMQDSRIKTAHLSRFALLLIDTDEVVSVTAKEVFYQHLRPRPDAVCRCLFETYFTLDADPEAKKQVLLSLVEVGRRAAPGQSLGSLGGALVRKTAEAGDEDAGFFLTLVPPTIKSVEAAEIALRRGQLAQIPVETISLIRDHFIYHSGREHRSGQVGGGGRTDDGEGRGRTLYGARESSSLLPRTKALEMSERISVTLGEQQRRRRQKSHTRGRKDALDVGSLAQGDEARMDDINNTGSSSRRLRHKRREGITKATARSPEVRVKANDNDSDGSEGPAFQPNTRRGNRSRRKQWSKKKRDKIERNHSTRGRFKPVVSSAAGAREATLAKRGERVLLRTAAPQAHEGSSGAGTGTGNAPIVRHRCTVGMSRDSDPGQMDIVREQPLVCDTHSTKEWLPEDEGDAGDEADGTQDECLNENARGMVDDNRNKGRQADAYDSGSEDVEMMFEKARGSFLPAPIPGGPSAVDDGGGRLPWRSHQSIELCDAPGERGSGRGAARGSRGSSRGVQPHGGDHSARDARAAARTKTKDDHVLKEDARNKARRGTTRTRLGRGGASRQNSRPARDRSRGGGGRNRGVTVADSDDSSCSASATEVETDDDVASEDEVFEASKSDEMSINDSGEDRERREEVLTVQEEDSSTAGNAGAESIRKRRHSRPLAGSDGIYDNQDKKKDEEKSIDGPELGQPTGPTAASATFTGRRLTKNPSSGKNKILPRVRKRRERKMISSTTPTSSRLQRGGVGRAGNMHTVGSSQGDEDRQFLEMG